MSDAAWTRLRADDFHIAAAELIPAMAPAGRRIQELEHLRTAHYAVYRARSAGGVDYVVRIGAVGPEDAAPADNTAFLGTAAASPSGQLREKLIAEAFAAAGADVVEPDFYTARGGLDALWLPFLVDNQQPVTAPQWHRSLTALQSWRPAAELPAFTNRAKTMARLQELPHGLRDALRERYDAALEALFTAATSWSVVHGDAHAGNVLNVEGRAVLFDFDTACWAPSVWDLTHLLNRAGTGDNTGYTATELAALFPYTDTEIEAALAVRRVAALVAKEHRNRFAAVSSPVRTPAAA
jgi:hypothetical protein